MPVVFFRRHLEGAACGDRGGLISAVELYLAQTIRNSVCCRSGWVEGRTTYRIRTRPGTRPKTGLLDRRPKTGVYAGGAQDEKRKGRKHSSPALLSDLFCDPAGARTQDPNIKSVVLYQLSYEINANRETAVPFLVVQR